MKSVNILFDINDTTLLKRQRRFSNLRIFYSTS